MAAGCDDPANLRPGDVRSYEVAKEVVPAAPAGEAVPPGTERQAGSGLTLRYELPPGWTDRGATGMRLASLTIGEPTAGHEVSVIPAAGSLEANVSRWIGQLDPAAGEAALTERTAAALKDATLIDVDGAQATVVLLSTDAASGQSSTEAILGAAIPLDETASLFVKFKGPADVARRERDNFVRFVSSIRWK